MALEPKKLGELSKAVNDEVDLNLFSPRKNDRVLHNDADRGSNEFLVKTMRTNFHYMR